MVFRLLMLGACVACVVFVATFEPVRIEVMAPPEASTPAPAGSTLSVVDIAAGVAPSSILSLIKLDRHERITAINDRDTADDYEADTAITAWARPGGYLDIAVTGGAPGATDRRVLVLVH
jgi:hypothetical protein